MEKYKVKFTTSPNSTWDGLEEEKIEPAKELTEEITTKDIKKYTKKLDEARKVKKGTPGRDKGSFDFFTDGELKKLGFYVEEEDEIFYVFDDSQGFNWTSGDTIERKAEEKANDLKKRLKSFLKK